MNSEEMKKWIEENVVMQEEAMKITGQKTSAFNQSVQNGNIVPFVEFGTTRKFRWYLRSDLEEYAKNKKK